MEPVYYAVDSAKIKEYMTFNAAVMGSKAPKEIISQLQLINVPYVDFNGKMKTGQLLLHNELSNEIVTIFEKIVKIKFPIKKIIPIVQYDWVDELSMADNNTSAFNFRFINGTTVLSNHSLGRAIDINPKINPYYGLLAVEPQSAEYRPGEPGVLTEDSPIVKLFESFGWTWFGSRNENIDYQHFQKL